MSVASGTMAGTVAGTVVTAIDAMATILIDAGGIHITDPVTDTIAGIRIMATGMDGAIAGNALKSKQGCGPASLFRASKPCWNER